MALTYDELELSASERRRLRENNRANLRRHLEDQAHERRMQSRLGFIADNPGAVSPQERHSIMSEAERYGFGRQAQERERLMNHEQRMLNDKIEGELKVATEKKHGMIGQGADAAKARAAADLEIEKERGKNALTLEERRIAAQNAMAELEWGKGGGRERIAEIEGNSRVGVAEAQAKAQEELQEQRNALDEQRRIAAAEKEKSRLKLEYDKLDQRERGTVDAAANKLVTASAGQLSFTDARAQVMAARKQSQQNADTPKEGDVSTLSTGRKIVYRNGKWQFAD